MRGRHPAVGVGVWGGNGVFNPPGGRGGEHQGGRASAGAPPLFFIHRTSGKLIKSESCSRGYLHV